MNDELLVVKNAIKGDDKALSELLEKTEKELRGILFFYQNKECDLSDIIQEVLIKIQKNIKKLKSPRTYKAWVAKIAMNKYYDFMRKNKTYLSKLSDKDVCECVGEIEDKSTSPMDKCITKEALEAVKKGLCSIKDTYRDALIMREFAGLSYYEIAKISNIEVGTVKSRISRARKWLKDEIKSYME